MQLWTWRIRHGVSVDLDCIVHVFNRGYNPLAVVCGYACGEFAQGAGHRLRGDNKNGSGAGKLLRWRSQSLHSFDQAFSKISLVSVLCGRQSALRDTQDASKIALGLHCSSGAKLLESSGNKVNFVRRFHIFQYFFVRFSYFFLFFKIFSYLCDRSNNNCKCTEKN